MIHQANINNLILYYDNTCSYTCFSHDQYFHLTRLQTFMMSQSKLLGSCESQNNLVIIFIDVQFVYLYD